MTIVVPGSILAIALEQTDFLRDLNRNMTEASMKAWALECMDTAAELFEITYDMIPTKEAQAASVAVMVEAGWEQMEADQLARRIPEDRYGNPICDRPEYARYERC